MKLITFRKRSGCTVDCRIDLDGLFETGEERKRFNAKWREFLASDPANQNVYQKNGHVLSYRSEQLIPIKKDHRPPLLLVFGNPATHSVDLGMFFACTGNKGADRFWTSILKPAGLIDLTGDTGGTVDGINKTRRKALLGLNHESRFRIGLSVIISMPSAPGGAWGGVAGIQKLIGARAMRRLEGAETRRILRYVQPFVDARGAVICFQKNAWNNLRSEQDPCYDIGRANQGRLRGSLRGRPDIRLFCVPPTRLCGPCGRVLKRHLTHI